MKMAPIYGSEEVRVQRQVREILPTIQFKGHSSDMRIILRMYDEAMSMPLSSIIRRTLLLK